jgi:hypothetical protein
MEMTGLVRNAQPFLVVPQFGGRDIALRCPRPRNSGRNESRPLHKFHTSPLAPLNAARTAQRAVPT